MPENVRLGSLLVDTFDRSSAILELGYMVKKQNCVQSVARRGEPGGDSDDLLGAVLEPDVLLGDNE